VTPGQELALDQLARIEAERSGAIAVVSTRAEGDAQWVTLSVDCRGLPRSDDGIALRDREKFQVRIPAAFPFTAPSVWTPHSRWAGVPHVQWSRYLCLYQAPETEWDPSDGMFGFLKRLLDWVGAAALGQLDAIGGPIHPPAVYTTGGCPMVIPRADTPTVGDTSWWGFAKMAAHGTERLDITEWCTISEALAAQEAGHIIAPAMLLSDPLPWEYPRSFAGLMLDLLERDVPRDLLIQMLDLGHVLHHDEHVYFVVGTPMRGTVGGESAQHLAVWRVAAADVAELYATVPQDGDSEVDRAQRAVRFYEVLLEANKEGARVEWCPVREARPEVTQARDDGSLVSAWADTPVAIWGCGALGSAVAEHLVRAGVRDLVLRDNSTVSPGVLVRQNFEDADLGHPKAEALAARLRRIAPDLNVRTDTADLTVDLGAAWAAGSAVVFDLTASPAVSQRLERYRMAHREPVTVISMTIGHDATHGLVVTSLPGATGGPVDVRRKAKIAAARTPGLGDVCEEFWPKNPHRRRIFQPEPGCSSPTFTGSNADVAALAAAMLLLASTIDVQPHQMTASFVSSPTASTAGSTHTIGFPNDIVTVDPINSHQIRTTPEAFAEMRAWARRTHRLSPLDETGGRVFGGFDDALGVVWISDITGPPPDSTASPLGFTCGTDGVDAVSKAIHKRTRGASVPVGFWHTHPSSLPLPSPTDEEGMTQTVTDPTSETPKQVMVIVGGDPEQAQLGTYVYERHKPNTVPQVLPVFATPDRDVREHRIGLALSGGGFRAVAFHLGVLRALHDRGVLQRVNVISSVSGGSIIAAMWAYTDQPFEEFDERVTTMLRVGLNRSIAKETLLTKRAPGHLMTSAAAAVSSAGRFANQSARRVARRPKLEDGPWLRRSVTLTTAVQHVFENIVGDTTIDKPARPVDVVINGCDLRTGTAFRFGSVESGSSQYGTLVDNKIPVAQAVAVSAAYPVLLPAVDATWTFIDRNGATADERVLLTDGGVYDNLGTTCLLPDRHPRYSTNVHPVDYIISADAGRGALDTSAYPVWWAGRMKRSFESVFRKVQDGGKSSLYHHRRHGDLAGVALPFLGQDDDRLPYLPPDLVRSGEVTTYPTNFSKVKPDDLDRLTRRGEQLTRLMIDHHCPEIA
jgi:predicted acylesterase/phospholipase RssA/molybdopterin/thiamine biosynthesis adenylyltransferase